MAVWAHVRGLLSGRDCGAIVERARDLMKADPEELRGDGSSLETPSLLLNTARDRCHPLDQRGGHGIQLPLDMGHFPDVANRVRQFMHGAALLMDIEVLPELVDQHVDREYEFQVLRYRPGEWLEEHVDTVHSRYMPIVRKVSCTVRLQGPQTIRWGYMDEPELHIGDAVAWASWRRHYVQPDREERFSLTASAFGPMWT